MSTYAAILVLQLWSYQSYIEWENLLNFLNSFSNLFYLVITKQQHVFGLPIYMYYGNLTFFCYNYI